MNRVIRLTLFALVGITLSATFVHAFTAWVDSEGTWNPRVLAEHLVLESKRDQALEKNVKATHRCLMQKLQVVEELADGRLTMDQAIRRFGEIEALREIAKGNEPLPTNSRREEELSLNVLKWVRDGRTRSYSGREDLYQALAKEHRARFGGPQAVALVRE